MSDAWAEIQALKSKRESRRIRLEERKKERQDILNRGLVGENAPSGSSPSSSPRIKTDPNAASSDTKLNVSGGQTGGQGESLPVTPITSSSAAEPIKFQSPEKIKTDAEPEHFIDGSFEDYVLQTLSDVALRLPMDSKQLLVTVNKALASPVTHLQIFNLLQKFAVQQLISIEEKLSDGGPYIEIITADHTKLLAIVLSTGKRKEEEADSDDSGDGAPEEKKPREDDNDVLSLLSLASTREKENKRIGEEILELLSRPSVKEKTIAERFRSQGGSTVKEFCPHGTKIECRKISTTQNQCGRLHFRKIIQSHTDESLGDCSFLNTCFHMETCKYVHYEVDSEDQASGSSTDARLPLLPPNGVSSLEPQAAPTTVLNPPQWIQCDLRFFDMATLGKFSVIMADPPWDIHMELPYGTLSDDEMRQLNIPALQDEGLIFLWVTGRFVAI
ncbi:unnamed protein product [Orchesella dallaii]|uniref:mRNA m(6)A methyltransferase n=1 Tax=Orchesella dallaii TaxID=48710 RepID=A0ABP1Q4B6_9HEXA